MKTRFADTAYRAESINWRSNDVMEWWSNRKGISPLSLKAKGTQVIGYVYYLSVFVPAQLKLIYLIAKDGGMDAARLERVFLLRCNKNFSLKSYACTSVHQCML